jgi:hypothetical protein
MIVGGFVYAFFVAGQAIQLSFGAALQTFSSLVGETAIGKAGIVLTVISQEANKVWNLALEPGLFGLPYVVVVVLGTYLILAVLVDLWRAWT